MGKDTFKTEVIRIRINSEDKVKLQQIAKKNFRSFSDQCRLVFHFWIESGEHGRS
jgi:hypothetical protein